MQFLTAADNRTINRSPAKAGSLSQKQKIKSLEAFFKNPSGIAVPECCPAGTALGLFGGSLYWMTRSRNSIQHLLRLSLLSWPRRIGWLRLPYATSLNVVIEYINRDLPTQVRRGDFQQKF
jgi:hypothetical protein